MGKKAIYLKVNRTEKWALDNLRRWINISITLGYDIFVICDNDLLAEKITTLEFSEYVNIIKSIKSSLAQKIVKRICVPRWKNAAYAHLTTFIHSKEFEYTYFWNIDADDTYMLLPIPKIVGLMHEVENYSINNTINCFSLDMWYTRLEANDWSFGITFTDNSVDWEQIVLENSVGYVTDEICHGNIDNYFFYLRSNKSAKIETWYAENMRFVHYSDDLFKRIIQAGMYHWKDGFLSSPIISGIHGLEIASNYSIPPDTVKFECGISDEEAARTILYYSDDGHARNRFGIISWLGMESNEIINIRQRKFNKNLTGHEEIEYVAFGTGDFFNNCIKYLKPFNASMKYVVDNDKTRHGKTYEGLKCVSPAFLKSIKNLLVIVMVYNPDAKREIEKQLDDMGIKHALFVEWERAVYADNRFI